MKGSLFLGVVIFVLVASLILIGVIAEFTDNNSDNSTPTEPDKDHDPNEKKIIFIGNSYSYYGNMVQFYSWDVSDKKTLLKRFTQEKGGFYQLCKQNGVNFSVTNWTFGSHTLQDLFGGG